MGYTARAAAKHADRYFFRISNRTNFHWWTQMPKQISGQEPFCWAVRTMEVLRLPFNTHSVGAAGQSKLLLLFWRQTSLSFFSLKQQHLSVLTKMDFCEVCGSFLILLLENPLGAMPQSLQRLTKAPIYWRPPGTVFSLSMMVAWQLMWARGLPWATTYSRNLIS